MLKVRLNVFHYHQQKTLESNQVNVRSFLSNSDIHCSLFSIDAISELEAPNRTLSPWSMVILVYKPEDRGPMYVANCMY